MMTTQQTRQLLAKYNAGKCNEQQKALIECWYENHNNHRPDISPEKIEQLSRQIKNKLPGSKHLIKKIKLNTVIAAITSFSLLTVGLLTFNHHIESKKTTQKTNIPPGSSKAILTLPNGNVLKLNGRKTGINIKDSNITYIDGTEISGNTKDLSGLTKITTPIGGEYQIVLSDGTKVWLNAASTLTFASSNRERKEDKRIVTLSGEAYFEVFKDKKRPFIVKTVNQEVQVLGTQFNINTYEPEIGVKTTLLEGSVRIISPNKNGYIRKFKLIPGEQSYCTQDMAIVKKVDANLEIAWKNGDFEFENANIKTIMTMASRWYDIEVIYLGKPITTKFTGSVSRSRKLSELLNFLESTRSVHFKIEGRRIIVMN